MSASLQFPRNQRRNRHEMMRKYCEEDDWYSLPYHYNHHHHHHLPQRRRSRQQDNNNNNYSELDRYFSRKRNRSRQVEIVRNRYSCSYNRRRRRQEDQKYSEDSNYYSYRRRRRIGSRNKYSEHKKEVRRRRRKDTAAVVDVDQKIYVIHGIESGFASVCAFDLNPTTTTKRRSQPIPLPIPILKIPTEQIAGQGFIILGSTLYVFGGSYYYNNPDSWVRSSRAVNQTVIYNLDTKKKTYGPPMRSGKKDPYAVYVNGKICVFEQDMNRRRVPNFELFDPVHGSWSCLPELPVRPISISRTVRYDEEGKLRVKACCVHNDSLLYISTSHGIYRIDTTAEEKRSDHEWEYLTQYGDHFPFGGVGFTVDNLCFTEYCSVFDFSIDDESSCGLLQQELYIYPSVSPLVKANGTRKMVPLGRGKDDGQLRFAIVRTGFEHSYISDGPCSGDPVGPHLTIDVIKVWTDNFHDFRFKKLNSSSYSIRTKTLCDLPLFRCFRHY